MSRDTKIPRTAKRFVNWHAKQPTMPADLARKADDAQAAHDLLAMNKNSKDFPAIKGALLAESHCIRGRTRSVGKVAVKLRGH